MTLADFEALVPRLARLAPIRAWPHANTAQTEPWVMAIALPEGGHGRGSGAPVAAARLRAAGDEARPGGVSGGDAAPLDYPTE